MSSYCDRTWMSLEADDIAGIESVYPPSSNSNSAPQVAIGAPGNGSSYAEGATITFSGSANDTQDGNVSSSLRWTSNLSGQIGTGASFSRTLAAGTHVITASVTDSGGLTGQAQVTINVTSNQSPPAAPSNLTLANLGSGVLRLNWSDNSGNESNFQIQRQRRTNGQWGSDTYFTVGANVTQFDNAPGAGRWRYRVRAQNGAGNSAWTSWRQIQL
jgi:hypothetical protein